MTDFDLFTQPPDDRERRRRGYARGMAASQASAATRWTEAQRMTAREIIRDLALRCASFTADDFWARALPQGVPWSKGVGALMGWAARRGWIERVAITPSLRDNEHGHAQHLGVWQSKLYRGDR